MSITFEIALGEEKRQMILLALAQLSLERPGWQFALGETAKEFPGGVEAFESFRAANSDIIPASKVAERCANIVETQMEHCARMLERVPRDSEITKEQAANFVQAALKGAAGELRKYAAELAGAENMGAPRG